MIRCVPPGNMISPPAANLIVRNQKKYEAAGVSQFIREREGVYCSILAHSHSAGCHYQVTRDCFSTKSPIFCLSWIIFSFPWISIYCLSRISFFQGKELLQSRIKAKVSGQSKLSQPGGAKTSFESPVSALHADCGGLCCRPDFAEYETGREKIEEVDEKEYEYEYEYEHEYEYKTGREKIEEVDEKEEQNENSHRFLFDM